MKPKLLVSKCDNTAEENEEEAKFHFAVVDLDKNQRYPLNFVCILPLHVNSTLKKPNIFIRTFGDKSLATAKKLLTDALRTHPNPEIRNEMQRRLELLKPKSVSKKKCVSCKKVFKPANKRKFRLKFCQDCIKKRVIVQALQH